MKTKALLSEVGGKGPATVEVGLTMDQGIEKHETVIAGSLLDHWSQLGSIPIWFSASRRGKLEMRQMRKVFVWSEIVSSASAYFAIQV